MSSEFFGAQAESPPGINFSSLQAAAANPVLVFLVQAWRDSQGWRQGLALDQYSGQALQPGLLQDITAGFREICCEWSLGKCPVQQLDRGCPMNGSRKSFCHLPRTARLLLSHHIHAATARLFPNEASCSSKLLSIQKFLLITVGAVG